MIGLAWLFVLTMRADRQMRTELIERASLFTRTIDPGVIPGLQGSESDLVSVGYQGLKNQLISIRKLNFNYRFVYLMGHRADGTVFFYVDSEPPDSEDYSPPGQDYPEVSAADLAAFDNGSPIVEGPDSDRWGTWVSVIIPIVDPASGKVLALGGVDIDATEWYWELLARVSLPSALLLFLVIALIAYYASKREVRFSTQPILSRLLLPLVTVMLTLMVLAGVLYWQQQQYWLDDHIQSTVQMVQEDMTLEVAQQSRALSMVLDPIAMDEELMQALWDKDVPRLKTGWQEMYAVLKDEYNITHFNFLDADRNILVQLGNPGKPGERNQRFTMLEAERSGKTAVGLELDRPGFFTLRVVQPVLVDGQLVGYVELAKEFIDILPELHINPDMELAVLLHKQYLDQASWQDQVRQLGGQPEWEHLPGSVVAYSSQGQLPEEFVGWAGQISVEINNGLGNHDEIEAGGKDWQVAAVPLQNAAGEEVGDLLVMVDITVAKAAFYRRMVMGASVGSVMLVVLMAFMVVLLRRTDTLVRMQQEKLVESEMHFQSMFLNHSAAMLIVDPRSGKILDANKAAARFYGYSSEQLKSMSIDSINIMEPASVAAERLKAVNNHKNYFQFQHRLASGEIRDVEAYSSPIDFGGSTVLFSIINDITDRRRAEIDLQREKDGMLQLLGISESFLESTGDDVDYQHLTDLLRQISGASYAAFNLFEDNGRDFRTVAVSGLAEHFQKTVAMLGFPFVNRVWPYDPHREAATAGRLVTHFEDIFALTGSVLPKRIISSLKNLFPFDETIIAKIPLGERVYGDFTFVMPVGQKFVADNLLSVYVRQVALLLQRKQAETALKASRQAYRQLVEQVPEVIYTDEIGGHFQYLSPNILNLTGYKAEELISSHLWIDLIHPADRERVRGLVTEFQVGSVSSIEYRLQTRDRGLIWVRDHGSVTRTSPEGRLVVQGLMAEITHQKEVEEALVRSEERFRQLAEVFPETIFEARLDGRLTYANEHAFGQYGMRVEDLEAGVNLMELVSEPDRAAVSQRIMERASGQMAGFLEYKAVRKDGSTFEAMAFSAPIRSGDEVVGLRGFVLDTSEIKRVERALAESETNFRTFFETSADIIVVASAQGQVLFGNQALRDKLGYELGQIASLNILDLFPRSQRAEAEDFLGAIARGERASCPLPLETRSGVLIPAETRLWYGRWSGQDCIFGVCVDQSIAQEAQQRFEYLFRNNPTPMALSSMPGRVFTDVNQSFYTNLGYTPAEVIGKTSTDLSLFANEEQRTRLLERVVTVGRFVDEEMQIRRKDGELLDGLLSGEIVTIQGRQYLLTVMLDITRRKQAETSLRMQSRLQQLLMEISSLYINISVDAIDPVVQGSLGEMAVFVGADRSYIFEYDFGQGLFHNTLEWCARGIQPFIETQRNLPIDMIPEVVSLHRRGEIYFVPDVHAMLAGSLKTALLEQEILSMVAVPMMSAEGCLGFVGFDWVRSKRASVENESRLLTIFAQMLVNVRKRKETEGKLQESQVRFKSLFEDSPISLWVEDYSGITARLRELREAGVQDFEEYFNQHPEAVVDFASRISVLDVNKASLGMFGVSSKQEMLAKMPYFFSGEVENYFKKELVLMASGATHCEMETVSRDVHGQRININLAWAAVPGHEEDLSLVIVSLQNISQRKRVELDLQASQVRFKSLFEDSPISLWVEDYSEVMQLLAELRAQGVQDFDAYFSQHPAMVKECQRRVGVLDVNKATLQLFGASSKEQLLGNLEKILAGDVQDYFRQELVLMAAGATHVEMETINNTLDGRRISISLNWAAVPGHEDDLSMVVVSLLDISRRKQAEEELQESEKSFRSLFDDSPIALWVEDFSAVAQRLRSLYSGGLQDLDVFLTAHPEVVQECASLVRVVDVNKAALSLYGASSKLELLRDLSAIFPEEADLFFRQELLNIAAGIPKFEQEGINQTLDGRRISVNMNWAVVPGHEEDLSVVIVSLLDITERKRAEADLLQTNRQLEESISLANSLAGAAEMANIAKSEFLANMSHEIRTPMNGVVGMTGLLLDTELDDTQRRYAETVRSSSESLLALLNDILDFSKIEAGKLELETLDFNLLALLDDLVVTMAVRANEKKLELMCTTDIDVPALLRGDPGRLRQVLINLLGNAIKFTPQGEVLVRVTCQEQDSGQARLRFDIRDTGIGIPESKRSLLFNKFSQVDASTTRQYGGSGLGLAISKQLVELMGGEIGVDSQEGHGSTFWFVVTLPLQTVAKQQAQPTVLPNLQGVRALVVDDNATNREILETRLSFWGMHPHSVANGPDALLALRAAAECGEAFTLAILDMQMPGMDGLTLARAIKDETSLAQTRLIMLTSLNMVTETRLRAEWMFEGVLNKPLRQMDLYNLLCTVLASAPAHVATSRKLPGVLPVADKYGLQALAGSRVLLVEDNLINQQVATGILKKFGFQIEVADNGAEALRMLSLQHYNLVLMDVQMPVMDGLEASRRIREPGSSVLDPAIPIVAMTARALQGDRDRCIEAGMNDYISKPINLNALAEVLKTWLIDSVPVSQPERQPESPPVEKNEPASPPTGMIFDRADLMYRVMDDVELATVVLEGYLGDIPLQITRLEEYLDKNMLQDALRQAHTIKGASANIGAELVRQVSAAMELSASEGDLEPVRARLPELKQQFERLKQEIEKELKQ